MEKLKKSMKSACVGDWIKASGCRFLKMCPGKKSITGTWGAFSSFHTSEWTKQKLNANRRFYTLFPFTPSLPFLPFILLCRLIHKNCREEWKKVYIKLTASSPHTSFLSLLIYFLHSVCDRLPYFTYIITYT